MHVNVRCVCVVCVPQAVEPGGLKSYSHLEMLSKVLKLISSKVI